MNLFTTKRLFKIFFLCIVAIVVFWIFKDIKRIKSEMKKQRIERKKEQNLFLENFKEMTNFYFKIQETSNIVMEEFENQRDILLQQLEEIKKIKNQENIKIN
eukprot:TRINITY_DN6862_c0_g1_i1.p1 TRINITY_DN6862_c0_g1~~TRINITY_DN6862_c0_g1_i1.p1  ORF type:complete len:102 (+),score=17.57 TRINITY_DN6862_c0_g1_i1:121-426(+)